MGKPRQQRDADKQKRRAARKAHATRRAARAKATVRRVQRAADDMLDAETFARVGYDAARMPAALEWLELDERERVRRIESYHRLLPPRQQPPNLAVHAAMHAIIETQLVGGDPPATRAALERLMGEGLDRHSAIHAVASVLSRHMHAAMRDANGFDAAGYDRDLSGLSKESWLDYARGD